MRWHTPDSSKYDEVIGFAKPELTPDDIVLKCRLCETDDQCQFGGSCIIDPANNDSKICNCTNSGAMGSHCDIIPSSNGICNPTFNTENYDWDGGDCCFGSCQGQECGIDGQKSYFGFKLEYPVFGYQDCKDPSMAELKFEVKGFRKRNGDIANMTIPLTIFCGSETVFQSLPFDWKMSEWNTTESDSELIMSESIRAPFDSECSLVTYQYQRNNEKPEFEYTIDLVLKRTTVALASGKRDRTPVEEQVSIYVPNQCIIEFLTSEIGAGILSFDPSVPLLEILSKDTVALNLCEEGMYHQLTERVVLWLLDEDLISLQNKNVHTKFHQCQGWGQPAVQLECNAKGFITSFRLIYSHKSRATIPTQIGFLSNLSKFLSL